MTFRLTTLMYLFALVAASLAFLGAPGLLLAVGVIMVWAVLLPEPDPIYTKLVAIGGVLLIFATLMIPAVLTANANALRLDCLGHLEQLQYGIQNVEEVKGYLPLAAQPRGVNGDLQSWRVTVLPFIENTFGFLTNFSVDEPWNGPNNARYLAKVSPWYLAECPAHRQSPATDYFAITGPQTAWGDGDTRTYDDVTDGLSNTILLIEASGRGVHWAEPKDLSFDEAVDLLSTPIPADDSEGHLAVRGYFVKPSYVRNVAMCEGRARSLHVPIPREDAIALLTASGGESVDTGLVERYSTPQLDYARVWAFSVFMVLAMLPAFPRLRPWIWPMGAGERSSGDQSEPSESEFSGKTASSSPDKTDS